MKEELTQKMEELNLEKKKIIAKYVIKALIILKMKLKIKGIIIIKNVLNVLLA